MPSLFLPIILKKAISAVVHIPLLFLGQIINVEALTHSSPGAVWNGGIKGRQLDSGVVYTRYRTGRVLSVVSHVMLFGVVHCFLVIMLIHFMLLSNG